MLQTRIGKRTAQAACRIAVEMAEDDAFPLTRAEAVERVAGLLADPPHATAERPARRGRHRHGPGRLAGPGLGRHRHVR